MTHQSRDFHILYYHVRLDGGPEERYALLSPEEVEPAP